MFLVCIRMRSHECHIVSNHRSLFCLFNSLCKSVSKKHQGHHYWSFVRGSHQWTVNTPVQKASDAEKRLCDDVILVQSQSSCTRSYMSFYTKCFNLCLSASMLISNKLASNHYSDETNGTFATMVGVSLCREREIKFIDLFGDRGHRGPYSPYKPYNHNLYIGIIIFPHIDNPQSTGYNLQVLISLRKKQLN